jgi:hypothetical protein
MYAKLRPIFNMNMIEAIVLAAAIRKVPNASLYNLRLNTSVLYIGPPPVNPSGKAVRLSVPNVTIIRVTTTTGKVSGNVIRRKTIHAPAPSTLLAA